MDVFQMLHKYLYLYMIWHLINHNTKTPPPTINKINNMQIKQTKYFNLLNLKK